MSSTPPARHILLARLAVVAAVLIAMGPVVGNDFGGWDDAMNLQHNPDFNPPSFASITKYWRHPAFDLYAPLTFSIWGILSTIAYHPATATSPAYLSAWPFHLANLLVHLVAALAVLELLRCLRASTFAAAAGAVVFAIHPIQVESVAWISGFKDVLAGALGMLALVSYCRTYPPAEPGADGSAVSHARPSLTFIAPDGSPGSDIQTDSTRPRTSVRGDDVVHRYALPGVLLLLAILAKSSAIVMPPIALLLDWGLRRNTFRSALLRSLPLFVIAIPLAIAARIAQPAIQIQPQPLPHRLLIAADALGFYLWKLVWPVQLGVDYGRTPPVVIKAGWSHLTWLAPLLLAIVSGIVLLRRIRWPAVALAIFILALAPTLGLLAFDFQAYSTVADHYAYIAMLAPAIAIAMLLSSLPAATDEKGTHLFFPPKKRGRISFCLAPDAAAIIVCGIFAALSFRQSLTWRDAMSISQQALRANPNSWASLLNIARIELDRNQPAQAIVHARRAAQLNPYLGRAQDALGEAHARLGQLADAEAAYRRAIDIDSRDMKAHVELANLLADQKRTAEAIEQYHAALSISPRDVITLTNLASVYAEAGQYDRAIHFYDAALSIDPNFPPARTGREHAVEQRGN